jgi:hypothetical protein
VPAFAPLQQARTLSIMPTFRCTAACGSCGTLSHPREGTRLDLDQIYAALDQAAALGYKLVAFTGGEATLVQDDLVRAIERAHGLGLAVRLVTNAWWATDDATAATQVDAWVTAGLGELNVSTGDQHARFVSIDDVLRAVRAGARAGLPIGIMVEVHDQRLVTEETVRQHPIFQQLQQELPDALISIHESPWMPLSPRRAVTYPEGVAVDRTNLPMRGGCDSVLSTTTVMADGTIAACCGLGMRLIPGLHVGSIATGSIREADEAAGTDLLKRWLRVDGPERILAWAQEHDPSIEWEGMYAHRCQACIRMYSDPAVVDVIRAHHHEVAADVVLREYLLHEQPTGSDADPA